MQHHFSQVSMRNQCQSEQIFLKYHMGLIWDHFSAVVSPQQFQYVHIGQLASMMSYLRNLISLREHRPPKVSSHCKQVLDVFLLKLNGEIHEIALEFCIDYFLSKVSSINPPLQYASVPLQLHSIVLCLGKILFSSRHQQTIVPLCINTSAGWDIKQDSAKKKMNGDWIWHGLLRISHLYSFYVSRSGGPR